MKTWRKQRECPYFARHNFHAPGRSGDIDCCPGSWRPSHLLIDGHASCDCSAIGKTTAAGHNYFRSHCSDSNVVGALCFFLRAVPRELLHNKYSVHLLLVCQVHLPKDQTLEVFPSVFQGIGAIKADGAFQIPDGSARGLFGFDS